MIRRGFASTVGHASEIEPLRVEIFPTATIIFLEEL